MGNARYLRRAGAAEGGGGCLGGKLPVPTERRQRLLDGLWSWRALVTGRIEGFYLCRDGRPKFEPSATASPPRIGSFADRLPERNFLSVLLDQ